jgi:hypothetical protein
MQLGQGNSVPKREEIKLAVDMPWAMRPPDMVSVANSAFRCTELMAPDKPSNKTLSFPVIVSAFEADMQTDKPLK